MISSVLLNVGSFVDVEGMKNVKQMISLLVITGQFIRSNRRGSDQRILTTGSRCS